MRVGILGGTGPAGRALATRLASVGVEVVVGSRSVQRAALTCEDIRKLWPERELALEGGGNQEAAGADMVVVATPAEASASTAASVAEALAGKVVVSMANALVVDSGEFRPVTPPQGSIAAAVQEVVPGALVSAAFHHLPAKTLGDLSQALVGDVLICSDSQQALDDTADLVRLVPGLRPLNSGSLAIAGPVEAFTAVLLDVNRRYRARAVLRLHGIPD